MCVFYQISANKSACFFLKIRNGIVPLTILRNYTKRINDLNQNKYMKNI